MQRDFSGLLCSDSCCTTEEPHQPDDQQSLQATVRVQASRARKVSPEWYKAFPWISVCTSRGKVFCHLCRKQTRKGKISMTKRIEKAFVDDGFNNWKDAKHDLQRHEESEAHQEACSKVLSEASKPISSLLVEQVNAEHVRRRRCLIKEVESLIYLLRQNLPIRRRTETEGNLHQLLVLRRKDVPDLHLWNEYLSPVVQNEIIKSIGTTVLRNVLEDIRAVKFYAIMADETTDTSMKEQFSLSIRWVDDKLDIHEDPVELILAEDTSGEALANRIKDALIRMQLPLQNCRGQAYDGAANMRGRIKGVSTRLQKECPSALYVHCLAHCTNLALQEASRKCKIIRNALDITNQITIFVRNSPKAAGMLRELVNASGSSGGSLRPLCPTRWTCRTASLESVLRHYPEVMDTLERISATSSGEHSHSASGMLALMEAFSTLVGLHLAVAVFSVAEDLSRGLQAATATVQGASQAVSQVRRRYKSMRSDGAFADLYKRALEASENDPKNRIGAPALPRKRRVPARLGGGEIDTDCTPEVYYRRQFYEVLDMLDTQLEDRFDQPAMETMQQLERVLERAATPQETPVQLPASLIELYGADVNVGRLENQLKLLPDLFEDKGVSIPARNMHQIKEVLVKAKQTGGAVTDKMMSEVMMLMRIYLTVPVTTSTAERSFSTLRRTKTYLRSTMSQGRLNAALMCAVHRSRVDELNAEAIATEFMRGNDRRRFHFGM